MIGKVKSSKAFTIIELLIVIAIIAILVLLATLGLKGYKEKARIAHIKHDVKVAEGLVGEYLIRDGELPDMWVSSNPKESTKDIYDTRGLVDNVVEGNYKLVPKNEFKSNLPGGFHANDDGKVYYEDEEIAEVDIEELVKSGFIPVANANELQQVNDSSNNMKVWGAGTEFEMNHVGGLDQKYIQVQDVDLSEVENFEPIGNLNSKFEGTYDGGGFEISNLTINKPSSDLIGLFGFTSSATIENVGLKNIDIKGRSSVGGLVGYISGSTVSNSFSTGVVSSTGSQVGGLVGYVYNGSTVSNSYATGAVTGLDYVGGLVGYNQSSTVSNSYATGAVTGANVGGLVGSNYNSTVSNSYATGEVNGTSSVGGLVGYNWSSAVSNSYATGSVTGNTVGGLVGRNYDSSTVSNSYATGAVSGEYHVGGLVGWSDNTSIVSNSYYDTTTTGRDDSGIGIGRTNAEMKMKDTYRGWNFDSIWQIEEGTSYPTLR